MSALYYCGKNAKGLKYSVVKRLRALGTEIGTEIKWLDGPMPPEFIAERDVSICIDETHVRCKQRIGHWDTCASRPIREDGKDLIIDVYILFFIALSFPRFFDGFAIVSRPFTEQDDFIERISKDSPASLVLCVHPPSYRKDNSDNAGSIWFHGQHIADLPGSMTEAISVAIGELYHGNYPEALYTLSNA